MKLAEYERELADARRKLEEISVRVKSMMQEEQELNNVVRGWEAIVGMERKQRGEVGPLFDSTVSSTSENPQRGTEEDKEDSENKTQFVREYIRANHSVGVTPRDLKKAAANASLKHPPSWPYGPLQRLKKNGEIIKRRGKFYQGRSGDGPLSMALAG